jgi:PAS domain S-box-containing protein
VSPSQKTLIPSYRIILSVAGFALAYLLSAELGRLITSNTNNAPILWPPSGLVIAVLLIAPRSRWWKYLLALIPASIAFDMLIGVSVPTSLIHACYGCLEAWSGAWLIRRFFHEDFSLKTVKELFGLILLSATLSTMISASLGTLTIMMISSPANGYDLWKSWWSGHFAGVLLCAPLILTWKNVRMIQIRSSGKKLEGAVAIVATASLTGVLYLTQIPHIPKLDLIVLPLLLFSALRFDLKFTAVINVIFSSLVLWGTLHGYGIHSRSGIEQSVLLTSTQIYVGVVAFVTLLMNIIFKEHARVRESLRDSELKYRTLVETADDAIEMIDFDGTPLYRNSAYYSSLGYSVDESFNSDCYSIVHPDDVRETTRLLSEVPDKRTMTIEYRVRHKDGHWVFRSAKASLVTDASGRPKAILLIIRDETVQKKAETALRQSEERYRFLVETSPLCIAVHQVGKLVYINPAGVKLLGVDSAQDLLGKPVINFVRPDYRDFVMERIQTIDTSRITPPAVEKFLKPDGSELDVEVISMLSVFEGKPAIQVVIQDITERKLTEDALKRSEILYRSLFEHMHEGFAYCRMLYTENGTPDDYVYINVNESFESIFRVPDIVGKKMTEIFPQINKEFPKLLEICSRVAMTGQSERFEGNFTPAQKWLSLSVYCPATGYFIVVVEDITQRKLAERTLRASEERYRTLAENMTDTVWLRDMDLHLTYISPSVTRQRGFTLEELQNMPLDRQLTAESAARMEELITECLREEDLNSENCIISKTVELEFYKSDGTTFWSDQTIRLIRDDQGNPVSIMGTGREITDRKKAEDALRASEARYRLISKNTADVIWTLDVEQQKFTYVSPSVERLRGYSAEEVMGQSVEEALTRDSYQDVLPQFCLRLEALRSGDESARTGINEVDQPCKDGSVRHTEIVSTILSDDGGRAVEILGVSRDITDRRRAEKALRESEEKFSRAFQHAPVMISIASMKDWRYIDINEEFAQATGFTREEVIGKTAIELGMHSPSDHTLLLDPLKTRDRIIGIETTLRTKGGARLDCLYNGEVIALNGEEHLLLIVLDITARKRSERLLALQEAFTRTLIDSVGDGILACDADGELVLVNRTAREWHGVNATDGVSEDWPHLYSLCDPDAITPTSPERHPMKLVHDGAHIRDAEYAIISTGNPTRFVVVNGHPIFDDREMKLGDVIVMHDITERKLADAALRESEKSYRGLFESVQDAIYLLTPEGTFVDVNEGAVKMYGYPKEAFVGRTPEFLSPPGMNDLEDTLRRIREVCETGEAQVLEWWGMRRNGEVFPKEIAFNRGRYFGMTVLIATGRDISERRKSEETMRENERSLREAQAIAHLGYFTYDQIQDHLIWSDEVYRIFGVYHETHHPTLASLLEATHPDDGERVKAFRDSMRGSGEFVSSLRIIRPTGEVRDIITRSHLMNDPQSGRKRRFGTIQDITESKQIERALLESEEKYRHLFEAESDALFLVDNESRMVIQTNSASCELYGYTLKEFMNMQVIDVLSETESEDAMFYPESPGSEKVVHIPIRYHRKKDGTVFPVEITGRFFTLGGRSVNIAAIRDISSRIKAEKTLRESEARLKAMFDTAGTAIALIGVDGKWRQCNRYWSEMFGYPLEEAQTLTVSEITHPDDRPSIEDTFAKILRCESESCRLELRFLTKNRSIVWGDLSVVPIVDMQGMILNLIGVCTDVTERKLMEENLRTSEERFRSIAEQMSDMIFVTNSEGVVTYLSPAAEPLFGYEIDEMVGRPLVSFVDGSDVESAAKNFQALASHEEIPRNLEFRMKRKDDSVFYGEFSATEYQAGGTVGVIRDVTDRKMAEQKLQESVQRFRDISEATGEFIWETDRSGRVTYLSNRFEQILGFTREELFGRTPFEMLKRTGGEWDTEFWKRERYLFGGIRDHELNVFSKSGKSVWLSVTALPILDPGGAVTGFRGAALDITERKLAAEALEESLQEKIALLKEVHHRVKNNLQIVISMLNLQAHGTENPQVVTTLVDTQNRVRSMALLHEALYNSGNLARINFSEYVKSLSAHLLRSYGAERSHVDLSIEIPSIHLPIDLAIPSGLIINELVSNSLKHAFPDAREGKILIRILLDGATGITLVVSDDGIGIPADLNIAKSKTLGLRLITSLARQLGGSASFTREKGTACTITFEMLEN